MAAISWLMYQVLRSWRGCSHAHMSCYSGCCWPKLEPDCHCPPKLPTPETPEPADPKVLDEDTSEPELFRVQGLGFASSFGVSIN